MITTTYVGRIDGMDVYEVYKDGALIGTNVSAPPETEPVEEGQIG